MTNLETNNAGKAADALAKGASAGAGESNRWAEIAVDSLKDSEQMKSGSGQSATRTSDATPSVGSSTSEAIKNAAKDIEAHSGKGSDGISSHIEPFKHFEEKVTDEQRKQAKEKLEKELSELIPDKDRQSLKNLHAAIIDGDLGKLQSTLKELSGNPEQLKKIVSALGKQFGKTMGVDIRTDSAGNVLLYERDGNTALSINPKTGESTLRPMETQGDGSVVLKPGEIINRTTGDVMKNIGDEVTRSLTHDRFYGILKPMIKPLGKPIEPWGKDPWGNHYPDRNLEGKLQLFNSESARETHYPRIPQELKQLPNK